MKKLLAVLAIIGLSHATCADAKEVTETQPAAQQLDQKAIEQAKATEAKNIADCTAKGGVWRQMHMFGKDCYIAYKDAKKPCKQNSDCLSDICMVDTKCGSPECMMTESTPKDHGICKGDNSFHQGGCLKIFNSNKPADCSVE